MVPSGTQTRVTCMHEGASGQLMLSGTTCSGDVELRGGHEEFVAPMSSEVGKLLQYLFPLVADSSQWTCTFTHIPT